MFSLCYYITLFLGWGGGGSGNRYSNSYFYLCQSRYQFTTLREAYYTSKQTAYQKVHCRNKITLKQKQQETVNTGIKLVGFLGVVQYCRRCFFLLFSSQNQKKTRWKYYFQCFCAFSSREREVFLMYVNPFFIYYPRTPVLHLIKRSLKFWILYTNFKNNFFHHFSLSFTVEKCGTKTLTSEYSILTWHGGRRVWAIGLG